MLWILVLNTTADSKSPKIMKPYSDNNSAILKSSSVLKICCRTTTLCTCVVTELDIYPGEKIWNLKPFIYLECLWWSIFNVYPLILVGNPNTTRQQELNEWRGVMWLDLYTNWLEKGGLNEDDLTFKRLAGKCLKIPLTWAQMPPMLHNALLPLNFFTDTISFQNYPLTKIFDILTL